jgi:hypothetical protein
MTESQSWENRSTLWTTVKLDVRNPASFSTQLIEGCIANERNIDNLLCLRKMTLMYARDDITTLYHTRRNDFCLMTEIQSWIKWNDTLDIDYNKDQVNEFLKEVLRSKQVKLMVLLQV